MSLRAVMKALGKKCHVTLEAFEAYLFEPVDNASATVFRIFFGLAMSVSAVRFMLNGWIEELYVKPTFFFKYPGFEWVSVPGPAGLYGLYGMIALSALCIAAGFAYRIASPVFFLSFSYAQLMDVTNYLNHYYLVVWISFLLCWMPLNHRWSVDSRLGISSGSSHYIPRWCLSALCFLTAVVYGFAALAKFQIDWLWYAQPMNIWLQSRTATPWIGAWFGHPWAGYVFSWAGFLYDASIVVWLLWPKTRSAAYFTVLVFHGLTDVLFDIGLFPWLMPILTTLFFEPRWPLAFIPRGQFLSMSQPAQSKVYWKRRSWLSSVAILFCGFHLLFPLRHYLHQGDVLWNEVGMRFSWKVMVREKNGSVTYRIRHPESARITHVSPHQYLQWRQAAEMSGQPDLIIQLGKYIAGQFEEKYHKPVQVFVDAQVSLNGRPAEPMIDPSVDILSISESSFDRRWRTPFPNTQPPLLRSRKWVGEQ